MEIKKHSIDDFRAMKHFEGNNLYWKESDKKIDFVFRKTKKFIQNITACCDIGIGNGYTVKFFYKKGVRTTGVDISPYLIEYFQKVVTSEKMAIELIETDITKSTFGEEKYDLVTCFDVFEHLTDEGLNSAIKNIATSLKSGGLLLGTVPLFEKLNDAKVICPDCGHKFHPNGHHQSFQNFDEIKNMLNSEFEVIKFGEVPVVFTKIFLFYGIGNYIFKLARRIILNKILSTAYFLAKVKIS